MYTQRNDRFRSSLTGKEYLFKPHDSASRRAALRQMETEHLDLTRASQSRADAAGLNRKLTPREIREGFQLKDERSARQKVLDDGTYTERPKREPTFNAHRERQTFLETQLAQTQDSARRSSLRLRIDLSKRSADALDAEIAARMEREALLSSDEFKTCELYGTTDITLLRFKSDVPEEWLHESRQRLQRLQESGNVKEFWEATDRAEAERKRILQGKAAALSEQAEALRAQAGEIRGSAIAADKAVDAAINAAAEGATDACERQLKNAAPGGRKV